MREEGEGEGGRKRVEERREHEDQGLLRERTIERKGKKKWAKRDDAKVARY